MPARGSYKAVQAVPFRRLTALFATIAATLRVDSLRQAGVRGLVGVVLVFSAAGSLNLWAMPLLSPNDEARHMGYALALAEGRIPDVLEPIDLEATKLGYLRGTNLQAAAAHPPLYHALIALPLAKAAEADRIDLGIRFARGLSLLFGVLSVLYVHRLIRLLFPATPHMALATAAMVATFPVYVASSSIGYSDSIGTLTFVATLASCVEVAVRGFTARRYLVACLWFALASLSRLPILVAVTPALLVLGASGLASTQGPLNRAIRILIPPLGPLTLAAAASGWFYALNISRYGDPSAASALLAHLERIPVPLTELLISSDWQRMFEYQWAAVVAAPRKYAFGSHYARGLLWLALGGGVVLAVRRFRDRSRPRPRLPIELTASRVIAAVCVVASVALLFLFRSKGGTYTARYAMPFAWAIGLGVAAALSWPRRPLLLQLIVAANVFLLFTTMEQYAEGSLLSFHETRLGSALAEAGLPSPELVVFGHAAVLFIGAALIVTAVGTLYPAPQREVEA